MQRRRCVARRLRLLWLPCLLLLLTHRLCTNIAAAQESSRPPPSSPPDTVFASFPTVPPPPAPDSELQVVDADSLLLRELDRLIELQERKVQLLTDMKRNRQQQRAPDAAAAPPLHVATVQPVSPSVGTGAAASAVSARAGAASPPPSPWHSFSVSNFVSRAALFLVAIACTVLYQHYSRKSGGERRRKAMLAEQEDIAALERQWRDRRLQSRRVMRDGELRRRLHRDGAAEGGAVSAVVYGDEDELREDEEQSGGGVLDEGQGDYWDAQAEEHGAYAGVLGTGEEAEDEEAAAGGQSREAQQPSSTSAMVAADDDDDDDEVEEEDGQDEEEEEQEEDGHG